MKKRGQFYILAAIIIISFLIGTVIYTNYARIKKEKEQIYDLGEELSLETGSVYDYGIYSQENTEQLIEYWLGNYSEYRGNIAGDWIFIYGNASGITILNFTQKSSGDICIQIPGSNACAEFERTVVGSRRFTPEGTNFTVKFKDFKKTFDLKEGENFFFIISNEGQTTIKNGG